MAEEKRKRITPEQFAAMLPHIKAADSILELTDFSDFPLSGMHVESVRLDGSSFERADLSHSAVINGYGNECVFNDANMDGALFYNCTLGGGCTFSGASLSYAFFVDCELIGADFRGVDLSTTVFVDCDLSSSIYDKTTVFADDFDPDVYGMVQA